MKRGLMRCGILLMLGLLLCGCARISMSRQTPEYSIGVVFKALNSPYWLDMQNGMEQAAAALDVDLTLLYPTGEQETTEQEQLINDLLDSNIDLLMVSPCDCMNTEWMLEKALENNIVMLTVDDHSINADIPYIGSDHKKIGQDAANYFKELLPEGGNIYILLGPSNQMSTQDRMRGLWSNLTSPLQISETVFTEMTQQSAYQAVMQAEEKIDGIFCHNIVLAQGAIVALEERGWDAKIITVDTREDGLQVMKRGTIDAVLQQDGYEIGYQAIQTAVETLKSGELPKNKLFTSELLTRDNAKED